MWHHIFLKSFLSLHNSQTFLECPQSIQTKNVGKKKKRFFGFEWESHVWRVSKEYRCLTRSHGYVTSDEVFVAHRLQLSSLALFCMVSFCWAQMTSINSGIQGKWFCFNLSNAPFFLFRGCVHLDFITCMESFYLTY